MYNINIRIDRNQLVYVDTWNWNANTMLERVLMPTEIIAGHELIHFWRAITGRQDPGTVVHWTIGKDNFSNNIIKYNFTGNVEEYRIVGVGNSTKDRSSNIGVYGDYNKLDDITENSLRKEQGLPYRLRYDGYVNWK